MEPVTGIADIEGARLYYEMAGEGPYLVLIHAGIADRRMWDDQFALFARQFRVVRYDLRGFGDSEMTPGPFSHRQDLYRLLRFFEISHAHMIGCSMGGQTAIDFTLEHPDIAESLLLVAPGLSGYKFDMNALPKQMFDLIAARKAGDLERAADLQVQIWVDGFGRTGPANAGVRKRVREMSLVALSNQAGLMRDGGFILEELITPPSTERLARITAPTMVVVGDLDDDNIRSISDLLVARIPNAQKIVLEGTAHLPNMEAPEEFNRVALGFLQRVMT